VVDTLQGRIIRDLAVVVADGRIDAVVPMSEHHSPAGIMTIDLKRKYLMPGLINSHVHLATSAVPAAAKAYLRRKLSSGVTAVRDMAGDARLLAEPKRGGRGDRSGECCREALWSYRCAHQ
jgi:imidazolonepropionase-like amidohydrolase